MEDRVYGALMDLPFCGLGEYFVRSVRRRFFLNGSNLMTRDAVPSSISSGYSSCDSGLLHEELRDKLYNNRDTHIVTWADIEILREGYHPGASFSLSSLGPLCSMKSFGELEGDLLGWFKKWSK